MRRSAGILEGEPLEVRQQKLSARLLAVMDHDEPTRERATVFLAEMIRAPFAARAHEMLRAARADATAMGDAIRAAWEDWLAAECDRGPVVLVLEDLHWGDLPTVRLVDAALRHLRDRPFFVLALARPEVLETFPGLWAERDVQAISLAPLTRSAGERLVREVLGKAADDETVVRLVQRAEGNAFYLEELIRSVAEGGSAAGALPETVVGMVQARLAGLSAEARRVLRAASVLGTTFWQGGVVALCGGERARIEVDEQLAHLAALEVITRRPESAFPEEAEWAFRHALVREGAYAMLTGEDRRIGHAIAGAWLEQRGATHALGIAEHFDRGGQAARAAPWWARAAEEALAGNDYVAAIDRAERAIAAEPSAERAGAMLALKAEAHRCKGQSREAITCGTEALARLSPHSSGWLRAAGELIAASGNLGEHARILELAEQIRGRDVGEAGTAQIVALCRAAANISQGGYAETAAALLAEADALLARETTPSPLAEGWIAVARGQSAIRRGDARDHLQWEERALAAFDRSGHARLAATRRMNVGHVLSEIGELERSERFLREALAAAERLGLPITIAYAHQNLARTQWRRGRTDEARESALRSARLGASLGSPRLEGVSRAYLAEILLGDGKDPAAGAAAEREAREAMRLLASTPTILGYAIGLVAAALLAQGRVGEAAPLAQDALARLEAAGSLEEGEALVRRVAAAVASAERASSS